MKASRKHRRLYLLQLYIIWWTKVTWWATFNKKVKLLTPNFKFKKIPGEYYHLERVPLWKGYLDTRGGGKEKSWSVEVVVLSKKNILWIYRVSNEEVIRRMRESTCPLKRMRKRRNTKIGYKFCYGSLLVNIMEGSVEEIICIRMNLYKKESVETGLKWTA